MTAVTILDLELRSPGGEPVDLWRTLVSHGFAELAPTVLDETDRSLALTIRVPRGRPRRVVVRAGRGRRARIEVLGPRPGQTVIAAVLDGTAHVLRLDQDLSAFYLRAAADPDLAWATRGAGRMLRSPTVFEDVVKTVCTTNCAWSATVRMVNALVTHLGEPALGGDGPLSNAFPTPETMAGAPESFYRDVVRAGYRGAYLIALSSAVARGELDLESFATATPAELPDEELEAALLALPGVGPYATAHIMMTLGRHSRLILDSWTRPKYARLLGRTRPVSDRQIERRFRPYGDYAGLAFWLYLTRDWVEEPA
ncbi:MAG TPA: Fe-S cluster assembly protein HesB [Actinomycetota bacterium]|nr:Fe-S cluster assembly protein HesB [Actinomycetota bacterium]